MHHIPSDHYSLCLQTTEESKQEKQDKKNDQPPQAKKPKVKTKTVELPVEGKLHWQLSTDVLNMFVENEVMLHECQHAVKIIIISNFHGMVIAQ